MCNSLSLVFVLLFLLPSDGGGRGADGDGSGSGGNNHIKPINAYIIYIYLPIPCHSLCASSFIVVYFT